MNKITSKWNKELTSLGSLIEYLPDGTTLEVDDITIAFKIWNNEIMNLEHLILTSPQNPTIEYFWKYRRKKMMSMIKTRYEFFYLDKQIPSPIPPKWTSEIYQNIISKK